MNRAWPVLFFVGVAGTVLLSHELTVGPRLQRHRVREAVIGFSCPTLSVESSGGSWSWRARVMRSALSMPRSCLSDLKQRIRTDARFHEARCNAVDRCWTRSERDRRYTFIFYPTYTSFRFEQG